MISRLPERLTQGRSGVPQVLYTPQVTGHTCFSNSANGYIGSLWSISGVSVGRQDISDGGRDMYDGGNRLQVSAAGRQSNLLTLVCRR